MMLRNGIGREEFRRVLAGRCQKCVSVEELQHQMIELADEESAKQKKVLFSTFMFSQHYH